MKKTSSRALSVLLILLISLPFAAPAIPTILTAPVVEAASSATITLDVSQGYVGDYVTVTGSGFTPNRVVTFMWGDRLFSSLSFITNMPYFQRPSYDKPGEVFTDALGNFIVQLQVPKLTRGTYTIKASDTETSATASFTINPRIILRNNYAHEKHGKIATPEEYTSSQYYIGLFLAEGFVGDWFSIQLSGFARGEMVEVKMDTTTLKEFTVGTTEEGYFFDTWVERVPDIPGGEKSVTATGLLSGITAWTTFKIKPQLFLASTPPSLPPPSGLDLAFPWLYASDPFGLGWYSSVNTAVDSPFVFEATGLTGTSIQSVSVTHAGGTVTCTLSGTLTIQTGKGSTQGISASTVPFSSDTPFGPTSPVAKISAALTSGTWLNVTIVTGGTEGATFTFPNQLFASSASTSETVGNLIWFEGEGKITDAGTHLSDVVDNVDELVATGLKAGTAFWVVTVYPSGTTVLKTDEDALIGDTLTWIDQTTRPLSYVDANGNNVWDAGEDVYQDIDNSGTATAGDKRINTVVYAGNTYWPWSTVAGIDADVGRTLVKFEKAKHPSIDTVWHNTVYLDYDSNNEVSAGDIRISFDREFPFAVALNADNNGFLAAGLTIPSRPGGGKEYNVGLWNFVADGGVQTGNSVTMQILASLEISTPTRFQLTQFVTEGSDVGIWGTGFLGDEPLTISVGGKYVTTVTPDEWGTLWWWMVPPIVMPALAGGEQSIVAQGTFTIENEASTNVTFTPALSVSPTLGYNLNPVTSIMVTGKGFAAGTYQIVFDGAGIGEAVTPPFTVAYTGDLAGQINIAFNLPAGVEGTHIVDVVKTSDPTKSALYGAGYLTWAGTARPDAPFPTDSEFPTVTIWPSLETTPTTTTVGAPVTVIGKGLQPSTTYYIWYDPRDADTSQAVLMTTTPTTVTTDAEGTLAASFEVPKSRGGTHTIWVSTSLTHVDNDPVTGDTIGINIEITPALVLAPSSGPVGTTVSVSVSGLQTGAQYQLWWYKPEEATINIFFGFVEVPQSAIPLAMITGALYGNSTSEVSFTVPSTAETGSSYSIDLTEYATRYSVLASPVFFTVGKLSTKITLSLTPNTVTQGENVTINGVVEPALSVSITLLIKDPEGEIAPKNVTSTSSGTFTDSFKPDKPGTWQVTAKWDGNEVYAAYTSPAAAVTVKPVDMSWAYALTGLGIGIVALVMGITISLYYFMRRRRVAPPPPT